MQIGDQKKAGVAILVSGKIDFEIKAMKRQIILLYNDKGINKEENIIFVSMYVSNIQAPKYI